MSTYTEPDFSSIALVTIDVQRDTLDGQPLEIRGTSAALPAMREVVQAFRESGRPIVHVVRLYRADGSNADLCRREAIEQGARILRVGTSGAELAPELLPSADTRLDAELLLAGQLQPIGDHEVVLYKPRWGAFFGTSLEHHLRALGVTTVAFCGCNFPNCPRTTLYEASERDFRIVLIADAVSGLYERGEREMQSIAVRLMDAESLAREIRPQLARRAPLQPAVLEHGTRREIPRSARHSAAGMSARSGEVEPLDPTKAPRPEAALE
jgi:nicotinamidase-related amidase